MSVKIMSAVWESGPENSTERFVLLTLANYANDAGAGAYPSFATIAKRCAISRRTAIRAVDSLIEQGFLMRRRRKKDGKYTSSEYKINVSKLLNNSDTASPRDTSVVTGDHHDSDTVSLSWCHDVTTVVTQCHQGSDTVSPNPLIDPSVDPSVDPPGEGESGAIAPALSIGASSTFRPVPENVQNAKGRRQTVERVPAIVANAPLAIRLLAKYSGYWPGLDVAPSLVERLGDAPDEALLERAIELWRLSGHKPTNWLGICDWYGELCRDPAWEPQARFKSRSANFKNDPEAREAHNRAVLDQVAKEIETGEWSPWTI